TARRALSPPLYPYTTLFRSSRPSCNRHHRELFRCRPGAQRCSLEQASYIDATGFRGVNAALDGEGESIHRAELAPLLPPPKPTRSEEHTSELQSRFDLVCRL